MAQSEPLLDRSFVAFLGRAYELKTDADYGYELSIAPVRAEEALTMATNFVEVVAGLIAADEQP